MAFDECDICADEKTKIRGIMLALKFSIKYGKVYMANDMNTFPYPGITTIGCHIYPAPSPPSKKLIGQKNEMRNISRYVAQKML